MKVDKDKLIADLRQALADAIRSDYFTAYSEIYDGDLTFEQFYAEEKEWARHDCEKCINGYCVIHWQGCE